MTIWLDAQLSPALALWLTETFTQVEAFSAKYLGLRDAEDEEIFQAAREAEAVVMTKDQDFVAMLERLGPPPKVIWLTCGNTSNVRIKTLLSQTLPDAIDLLAKEPLVEISD
ncbi:MAG: DUF5615 family PIN-like protein [Bacteroidota bacterium]